MAVIIRDRMQLETAKAELAELKAAWKKILHAQSYSVEGNQVNRASLKEIKKEIDEYEAAIDAFETKGSTRRRAHRVVPY